jgi:insertion element IS1 protein InsB
MENTSLSCPHCESSKVIRYGRTYYHKPRSKCKDCGRQFVVKRQYPPLSQAEKSLIERLLLERISLLGICRVLNIREQQLYAYMEEVYRDVPTDLYMDLPADNQGDIILKYLDLEADEAWSFVGYKQNKVWIWVAMHRSTRQIVGLALGDRSQQTARQLWESIPVQIRENARVHTDDWEPYKKVIPKKQHASSKFKKDTNHMERFFCTLRQRASRLVRLALSFSKTMERHLKAIRYFIASYNLEKQGVYY